MISIKTSLINLKKPIKVYTYLYIYIDEAGFQANELEISLTFTLLDELFNFSPTILENVLKNIYSIMVQLKSELIESNEYQFYEREQVLNRHRDYLIKLIKSKQKISGNVKDLALRILIIIGNIRESREIISLLKWFTRDWTNIEFIRFILELLNYFKSVNQNFLYFKCELQPKVFDIFGWYLMYRFLYYFIGVIRFPVYLNPRWLFYN